MKKVKVLVDFRGVDFSEIFEEGTIHLLEDARAESLALRRLVTILDEPKVETPKVEEPKVEAPKVEVVAEQTTEEVSEEKPHRGRPKASKE